MTPEQIIAQRLGELEWTICDLRAQLVKALARVAELEADRPTLKSESGEVFHVERVPPKAA